MLCRVRKLADRDHITVRSFHPSVRPLNFGVLTCFSKRHTCSSAHSCFRSFCVFHELTQHWDDFPSRTWRPIQSIPLNGVFFSAFCEAGIILSTCVTVTSLVPIRLVITRLLKTAWKSGFMAPLYSPWSCEHRVYFCCVKFLCSFCFCGE